MAERKTNPPAEPFGTLEAAMAALGATDGRHIYRVNDGDNVQYAVAGSPTQALCCIAACKGWTVATVSQKEQLAAARAALASNGKEAAK